MQEQISVSDLRNTALMDLRKEIWKNKGKLFLFFFQNYDSEKKRENDERRKTVTTFRGKVIKHDGMIHDVAVADHRSTDRLTFGQK